MFLFNFVYKQEESREVFPWEIGKFVISSSFRFNSKTVVLGHIFQVLLSSQRTHKYRFIRVLEDKETVPPKFPTKMSTKRLKGKNIRKRKKPLIVTFSLRR